MCPQSTKDSLLSRDWVALLELERANARTMRQYEKQVFKMKLNAKLIRRGAGKTPRHHNRCLCLRCLLANYYNADLLIRLTGQQLIWGRPVLAGICDWKVWTNYQGVIQAIKLIGIANTCIWYHGIRTWYISNIHIYAPNITFDLTASCRRNAILNWLLLFVRMTDMSISKAFV